MLPTPTATGEEEGSKNDALDFYSSSRLRLLSLRKRWHAMVLARMDRDQRLFLRPRYVHLRMSPRNIRFYQPLLLALSVFWRGIGYNRRWRTYVKSRCLNQKIIIEISFTSCTTSLRQIA